MKKSLFAMVAVGAVTLASCSNDEMFQPSTGDGNVTITAQLPTALQGRYGEGSVIKKLEYAVYEGDDVIFASDVDGSPAPVTVDTKNFTLSLNLVKGKTYDLLFWADAADQSPYTFTSSTKSVTVTYDNTGNNENRDAFFQAVKNLTVNGPVQKTVELRRPFAQVNIGTSDLADFRAAKKDITSTTMTVSGVYDTLNLLSGEASGSAEITAEYTAAIPEGQSFPVDATKYDYLAMNYILTGAAVADPSDVQNADRELIDIDYKVTCNDGHEIDYSFTNVPVQRNYRTNIYGALLTNPANFDIVVIPGFNEEPGHNAEVVDPHKVKMGEKTYGSIAEAVTAAKSDGLTDVELILGNGEYPADDLNTATNAITNLSITGQGPETVINKNGANNTIAGVNIAFNNITLKSTNDNYNGFQHNASETYTGCVIEKKLFLYGKAKFENCTFKNDGDYSVWTYGSPEATFESCTFGDYGKAILMYGEASLNAALNVNNCTFNGSSLNDGKAAIEIDCSFNTGDDIYTVNIINSTATGYDEGLLSGNNLWNVKKGTKFEITVDGNKTVQGLTTDGKNDYFLNAADGLVTLAKQVNGYYKDNAIAYNRFSGKTVTMTDDIDMDGVEFTPIGAGMTWYPSQNFAGTFNGMGHTISNLTASDSRANHAAAGLFGGLVGNVKNVILENVNINSTHYAGGIAGYVDNETGSIIDNCKVIGGTITSATEQIGDGWDNGDKAGGILGYGCIGRDVVTNCTVEDVTIKAYRHFGAIVGHADQLNNVSGNTAKNVTLLWDKVHDYKNFGSIESVPFGSVIGNSKELGNNTAENISLPTE